MILIALVIAAALVGIDRLTKWLAIAYVKPVLSIPVLKVRGVEVISLTYCENTGASFSILQGQRALLIAISLVFVVVMLALLLIGKIKPKMMIWAFALIIAGGVGNLIDRISTGYVVDFIDFKSIGFAVFNFADMCAVIGAFMLFFAVLRDEIREYKARKACAVENPDEVSDE